MIRITALALISAALVGGCGGGRHSSLPLAAGTSGLTSACTVAADNCDPGDNAADEAVVAAGAVAVPTHRADVRGPLSPMWKPVSRGVLRRLEAGVDGDVPASFRGCIESVDGGPLTVSCPGGWAITFG